MSLKLRLAEHKEAVVRAWFDQSVAIYSDAYAKSLRENADPFANPVGAILKEGLARLFDALRDGANRETCRAALGPIVRVRAVQDVLPSQALAFIPLLKSIARQTLREPLQDAPADEAWLAFDIRIDEATLLAFDLYAECRQKISELGVNEARRNVAGLLRVGKGIGPIGPIGPIELCDASARAERCGP